MSWFLALTGVVVVGLAVYLVAALIHPEDFS